MGLNLLFMGDYGADPLWDAATEAMVDADQLPLSQSLRDDVREWARAWEERARTEIGAEDAAFASGVDSSPVPVSDWERLDRDADALCQRLRHELGSGWLVGKVSFHDGARQVQWEAGGTPMRFQPGTWGLQQS